MESQTYRAGEGGAAAHPGAGEPSVGGQGDAQRLKDEARRGVQTVKDEAGAVAQQAKHHAGEAARQVKDSARVAAEQTKRKAAEYADQARTRGVEMLDQQRHTAASQLQTVGEAVHRAADKFREDKDENIAGYVDALADEVDRCARYLGQRDMGSLVRDAQHFARRNPEWFLGGMFFAGLALSRFLKASRPESQRAQEYPQGYTPDTSGGGDAWGRESGRYAMGADTMSSHSINTSEPISGATANAGPGVAGMPGSAASDATMPASIGESGSACGPIEQQ